MRVLVPFDARSPKTRLSGVLDDENRNEFARVMLDDVLEVLQRAGHQPHVISTGEVSCECPVRIDEQPLTAAINDRLAAVDPPVGIVMADLALLCVATVERLVETDGDVVIAPGLGGGTNALVVRTPDFRVDYHGTSFRDHRRQADSIDATSTIFDSFRVTLDIDEPDDLVEVLLHNQNRAATWLEQHGFSIGHAGDERTLLRSVE